MCVTPPTLQSHTRHSVLNRKEGFTVYQEFSSTKSDQNIRDLHTHHSRKHKILSSVTQEIHFHYVEISTMYNPKKLANAILDLVRKENEILISGFQKGIFDCPELALVYMLGKELATDSIEHFGTGYQWVRETNFGQGGPTDLAFVAEDETFPILLFEFKMDDTYHVYANDIKKLRKPLTGKYASQEAHKFFCGLKWCNNSSDKRVFEAGFLEQTNLTTPVLEDFFPTIVDLPTTNRYCYFSFWEVE